MHSEALSGITTCTVGSHVLYFKEKAIGYYQKSSNEVNNI